MPRTDPPQPNNLGWWLAATVRYAGYFVLDRLRAGDVPLVSATVDALSGPPTTAYRYPPWHQRGAEQAAHDLDSVERLVRQASQKLTALPQVYSVAKLPQIHQDLAKAGEALVKAGILLPKVRAFSLHHPEDGVLALRLRADARFYWGVLETFTEAKNRYPSVESAAVTQAIPGLPRPYGKPRHLTVLEGGVPIGGTPRKTSVRRRCPPPTRPGPVGGPAAS